MTKSARVVRLTGGDLEVNTYLVGDERECFIVDPGVPTRQILKALGQRQVKALLLTHGHYDHLASAEEVRAATGAPFWVPEGEAECLTQPLRNLSGLFGLGATLQPAERLLKPGETIEAGGVSLRTLFVPGHTPGHFAFSGDGFVLTGDTLFAGSIGRSDFPGGSSRALIAAIRQELFVLPDDTKVLPGHGEATTIGEEKRGNPYL